MILVGILIGGSDVAVSIIHQGIIDAVGKISTEFGLKDAIRLLSPLCVVHIGIRLLQTIIGGLVSLREIEVILVQPNIKATSLASLKQNGAGSGANNTKMHVVKFPLSGRVILVKIASK